MIDTAALREKVLDLAIRGKLVPQDPNDEPASVLLERIHEQKLQMVREGKLKAKDVKDDTIIFKGDDNCYYEKYSDGSVKNIQDEIPFDLPDGWSWCRLNSICSLISDIDHKMPKSVNDGVLFLSAKDLLNDGTINYDVDVKRISEEDYLRLSKKAVPQINDIIYSRIGACLGKARVVNRNVRFLVSYSCCTIRPLMIDSTFLALILDGNFVLKQAKKETQSVGVPDLGIKNIKDFLIPIPPLNEQSRIDTCLKNALSLVDNISYNATCVDEDIDVLQSRILELAIQGKLVPQDENDEPASVLLERIRAERKEKLGKKYVESYIYKGDDNCYYEKVGSTVKNITDQIPFSIPQNWSFVRLKKLAKVVSGVSYDKRDICNDGIRIIRGGNISNLSIVLLPDDVFLPQKYYDNEKEVKTEDIVIVASTGSKIAIGRPAFADKSFPQTQIGAFLRIVRPYVPNVYQYLKCLFASNYYREHISDLVHGNTINNIKTEYLDEFIIPFPPIREQKEIANKVKILMDILKGGD